jgi:nucleotide-binding universal stress UspA family protein
MVGMFERILVPLDGSKTAESVLPYVKKLAFRAGSELTLLHIIDPQVPLDSPDYAAFMRRPTQNAKEKAQEYLRGIAEDLQGGAYRYWCGPSSVRQPIVF